MNVELTPFKRVVCTDPSEKTLEQARLTVPQNISNRTKSAQRPAEDLPVILDSTVDLVVAGLFPLVLA